MISKILVALRGVLTLDFDRLAVLVVGVLAISFSLSLGTMQEPHAFLGQTTFALCALVLLVIVLRR